MSLVGTIFLVVTAIMMMLTIERAFNNIWRITQRRQGLAAFLRYWAVLSLAPVFIAVSIGTTTYLVSLPFVTGTATLLGAHNLLLASIPIILTIAAFTLLYVAVPNCKVPFLQAFIAAIVATTLFQIAKRLFVIYVWHIPNYQYIYGAMAAVPIFLVWLYLLWVIILFGALISNVLVTGYFIKKGGEIDGFAHAFLWLGYLWKAQQEGKGLSINQLYKAVPGSYRVEANKQLRYLQENHLIQFTYKGKYVLARDFSKMTLGDLYAILPWKLTTIQEKTALSRKVSDIINKANHSLDNILSASLDDLYGDLFDIKD